MQEGVHVQKNVGEARGAQKYLGRDGVRSTWWGLGGRGGGTKAGRGAAGLHAAPSNPAERAGLSRPPPDPSPSVHPS